MFRAAGQLGGAGARYRDIEMTSRIDGASPHRLIAILFEELLRAIDAAKVAMERQDQGRLADKQARALSILQALEASLDVEKGGEIATNLSAIYREGRRLLTTGTREKRPELIAQARTMLADIASAWDSIGESA